MQRNKQRPTPTAKSLANLIPQPAPDAPGETEATTVRVGKDDLEWLRSLPEGVSYHVRQAVKQYRKRVEDEI